jgi:hypothetical protein
VIHPDVAYDIQTQTGSGTGGTYLAPHQYAQPAEIWAGEIGALNGFRFIETPRAMVYNNANDDNLIPLTTTTAISAGTYTSGSPLTLAIVGGSSSAPLYLAAGATLTFTDSATPFVSFVGTVLTAVKLTGSGNVTFSGVVPTGGLAAATTSIVVTSGGAGVDSPVYSTYLMGRQSLAKVHSIVDGNGPVPKIIPGPVTDTLRRFVPLGWYWLGGYSVFRQPALLQYFTQSSLTNIDPGIDN